MTEVEKAHVDDRVSQLSKERRAITPGERIVEDWNAAEALGHGLSEKGVGLSSEAARPDDASSTCSQADAHDSARILPPAVSKASCEDVCGNA